MAICGGSITDKIDNVGVNSYRATAGERVRVLDEDDLASRRAHIDVARDIRCNRERGTDRTTR